MDYIDDGIIGCPDVQADYWEQQHTATTCATTAECSILRQFGYDIDQDEFAYISAANGWYQPGAGTEPEDIGKMMDMAGIANHAVDNASLENLLYELSKGHGVIVGVKSDQLWEGGALQELKNFLIRKSGLDTPEWRPADHAIMVTGMDFSDPEHPMVIVNDSGDPTGKGHAYPLDRFMDAWQNGNFYYTATDDPLPSIAQNAATLEQIDWSAYENGISSENGEAMLGTTQGALNAHLGTTQGALNTHLGTTQAARMDDDFFRMI